MTCEELQQALQQEANGAHGKLTALVKEIGAAQPLFAYEADKPMVSASVIKVPMMVEALRCVQQGTLALDEMILVPQKEILDDTTVFVFGEKAYSLQELLTWMIILSDNTATNVLMDVLGMDAVNATARQMGLTGTKLQRKMLDFDAITQGRNNYTTAADQARIFEALYAKTILTPALCDVALTMLRGNRDTGLLLRYLWQPLCVAHKSGGLDYLSNDVGVVEHPAGAYYIGVFIDGAESIDGDPERIGRMSKLVFDYKEQV